VLAPPQEHGPDPRHPSPPHDWLNGTPLNRSTSAKFRPGSRATVASGSYSVFTQHRDPDSSSSPADTAGLEATATAPEARPRAQSHRFTIWKALLVMITQRGVLMCLCARAFGQLPGPFPCGPVFYNCLGSTRAPAWRTGSTRLRVVQVAQRPTSGNRRAKKSPAPKRGQVVLHVCLRGVGVSTCLPT
jgi:hypothetical protein